MNQKKNKYFLISMVKNEADIIESFVRYHLNIFDGIVILDNKSTDNTWIILEKLKKEGLPLTIIQDDSLEFIKGKKTTKMLYETLNRYNPDIIFILDADEFLVSSNHQDHPRDFIDQLTQVKVYYLQRENYYPHYTDNMGELFVPRRITYKSNENPAPKVVFTKEIMNRYPINVRQGNHGILPKEKSLQRETLRKIKIAHYSIRSDDHFKSKAVIGWIANLSRHDRTEGASRRWAKWFEKIKNKPNFTLNHMLAKKKLYHHPINLSFCKDLEIRYTKKDEVCFMRNFLSYCELLAIEQARLRNELLNKKK
ncbi:glycosyltransferase family 2 protein [Alkalihalobacterium chitinilyticum]|uniref:Glycosyltransferase family 2 protein n=1 Tax=Alkalihalobacterium chitinilyticum TaxID=2980103 RepID=A0ABT5VEP0_9BACI|nr:glycosyltransferase family 2 protein [Alkalihalobacterium chitinilyticum]MDE5412679.1 glycosyltransferase family 2 protein [Alkalihalobacterium chitinilyticum]